jgi:hypothetical protein
VADEIIYYFVRGQGWLAGYEEPIAQVYEWKFTTDMLEEEEQRWLRMQIDYMRAATYLYNPRAISYADGI